MSGGSNGRIGRWLALSVLVASAGVLAWPALASATDPSPASTGGSVPLTSGQPAISTGSAGAAVKRHRARITAVVISGTSASPAFTVTGINFGTQVGKGVKPPCRETTNPGRNYGKQIYFNDDSTAHWQAGTGRDCIGLVIGSWSETSVSFTLGSWYSWSKGGGGQGTILNNGDPYVMTLKGAHFSGTVAGLSGTSS